MQVLINKQAHTLPEGATLADALALLNPRPPFAAALNMQFVPRSQYQQQTLAPQDEIELIFPVTGG